MTKRQYLKNDGTSTKKTDPTVLTAIIGGIVTIIVTFITVVIPLLLKTPKATLISPTVNSDSGAALATTPIALSSTYTPQTETTATPATANDLTSIAGEYLNDVKVEFMDTFDTDSLSDENWGPWSSNSVSVDKSALKLTSQPNEDVGITRNHKSFASGEGIVLRFKSTNDTGDQPTFDFGFDEMNVPSDQSQSFAIYDDTSNASQIELNYGRKKTPDYESYQGLSLKPDTWYDLLMAIGPNADLLIMIWDPTDQLHLFPFRQPENQDWANLSWSFSFLPKEGEPGSLYVDDYTEISFSSIK